ncbi:hypothetical protein BpHYR1_020434 [Brachionus plicatilis]|uniref:Uncharacterized protein n=1 Tax=Brachionus plicatilis TaxID=10195 RepID=A0A3M7RFF1_BRAPC|nr:hypothetical protein BpHYR1_020434 [Brachionus plicatilis]
MCLSTDMFGLDVVVDGVDVVGVARNVAHALLVSWFVVEVALCVSAVVVEFAFALTFEHINCGVLIDSCICFSKALWRRKFEIIIAMKNINEEVMINIDWLFDQTSLSVFLMFPYHVVCVVGVLAVGILDKMPVEKKQRDFTDAVLETQQTNKFI